MDIVSIECPNCGAKVNRSGSGYFATCPYCGVEVCFDEIKGEAQAGKIDELQEKIEKYKQREQIHDADKEKIRNWMKWRNIMIAIISGLVFFAFIFVGAYNGDEPSHNVLVGIGSMMLLIAGVLFLSAPPLLGYSYPDYDLVYGRQSMGDKALMWLKITGITFVFAVLAAFVAYLVLEVFQVI